MKNKRAEQILARQKHRESLKAIRRKEPIIIRTEPSRTKKPSILIYCEGKNTEPSYFNQFKLPFIEIDSFGEGKNTLSLVKRAIQLSEEKSFDQVWCVFDADPKPDNPKQAQNFNSAVKLATEKVFGLAYSNQAFEYWLILHFEDHQGGKMNRNDYSHKINNHLKAFGLKYDGEKSKIVTEEIFEILDGVDNKTLKKRKEIAIERAKRGFANFDHKNPAEEESSTTVFRLVEELIKYE